MSDSNSEKAIVIERVFDAPINIIWKMWTEAEHFENWYGPKGFSVEVAKMDIKVGGKRLICMTTPDGNMKMWFTGEFTTVESQKRLVYTDSMADEDGNVISPAEMGMPGHPEITEVTVVLESTDSAGTKMTMTHAGIPADSPGASGWNQAFDKLADHIKSVAENKS